MFGRPALFSTVSHACGSWVSLQGASPLGAEELSHQLLGLEEFLCACKVEAMPLKQQIETWVQALIHYDSQEFEKALKIFDDIADTSKILFNCGIIYATIGEHKKAVVCYQRAIGLDPYLAVAYFQEGVSNFLLGDFEEALANFNDTLLYLRGNSPISYEQLGLKFDLFSCEVLFNRGLCYIYLCQMASGMQDLEFAAREKATADHDVIDDAIRDRAEGYTVFSIPAGVVYRPNAAKVKNLKIKNYLGSAEVVATTGRNNMLASSDRSYGSPILTQRHSTNRTQQSSQPSLNCDLFSPTPAPDVDRAGTSNLPGSYRSDALHETAQTQRLELSYPGSRSARSTNITEKPGHEVSRIVPDQHALKDTQTDVTARPRHLRVESGLRKGISGVGPLAGMRSFVEEEPRIHTSHAEAVAEIWRSLRRKGRRADKEREYGSRGLEDDLFKADFRLAGRRQRASSPTSMETQWSSSREPYVYKLRVKVHNADDTRYIIISSNIEFAELEARICEKFGFQQRLRIKMCDDGDMITMTDQTDLILLIELAGENARCEGAVMGKIEVWVEEQLTA